MKQALTSLLLIASSLGCTTTTLLDFTIVSTRTVQLAENPSLRRTDERVSGEMLQRTYLIFPVGHLDVRTTIEQAIASRPGCVALLDGSIQLHDRMFFPLIYGETRLTVEGTPLIDDSQLAR